jgi:signal transduction histidine kinase
VVTSIKDAYGHPDRLLSVSRDITEHQQAEEERERLLAALAQERERLKALTDTLEERVLARTEQVRALAAKVSLAEHEERKRISQILHDYVQQMLYGIQMRMYLMASDIAEKNLESLQIHFQEMKQLIEEAVQAVRTLSVELSPPSLRDEGLAEAMTWLAERMKELHGLQVAIDVHGDCQVADSSLRMVLFQIVQELLFNVVKHAETDQAFVTLRREGEKLTVTVRDEGKGFETAVSSRKDPRTGLGLSSIRERLALFGGDLDVASAAGKGTRIRIDLPLH